MEAKIIYKLTEFSPGAGCGCKISPAVLDTIIGDKGKGIQDLNLLVGNQSKDDAAVYDLGNGQAVISTTDFFMPITDDAYDFGRIASANAISDIYAMGGKPLMAISILGWPLEKLPPEMASEVLDGSREICSEAGIQLAGGHSIDSLEPIFGLAVTGLVDIKNLKRNDTATPGCSIFLTKPLGIGILSTAEKMKILKPSHTNTARDYMIQLNMTGYEFGKLPYVKAMTDVTGFGLLGHLLEICEGSKIGAEIRLRDIPVIDGLDEYINEGSIPGGTTRNWESYGEKIEGVDKSSRSILCDPQTSGGLLLIVTKEGRAEFTDICSKSGIPAVEIGTTVELKDKGIFISVE